MPNRTTTHPTISTTLLRKINRTSWASVFLSVSGLLINATTFHSPKTAHLIVAVLGLAILPALLLSTLMLDQSNRSFPDPPSLG